MFSHVYTSLRSQEVHVRLRLLLCLLSATAVLLFFQKDEDASKRDQELQIDVAFIIHGSENITSPERKKSYNEALDWAKKIVNAFGEIGINKTRAGLIVYAEKPELMFNFTEKLEKGEVMGAVDEAASPPPIGNKTFTGKALWFALQTLVGATRQEALKKFFVFSDRPPDDNPMPPALAIQKKKVDLYGLGQTTAPYSDWYISDYSLDSLYAMLNAGPFKGREKSEKGTSFQNQLSEIMASSSRPPDLSNTKVNQLVTSTTPKQTTVGQNQQLLEITNKTTSKFPTEEATLSISRNSSSSGNTIASVIAEVQSNKESLPENNYGNDASVVVTTNSEKSVGRYSSGKDISYKSTDFGTIIAGKKLTGQSPFTVIKPRDQNIEERSNLRLKVRNLPLTKRVEGLWQGKSASAPGIIRRVPNRKS